MHFSIKFKLHSMANQNGPNTNVISIGTFQQEYVCVPGEKN